LIWTQFSFLYLQLQKLKRDYDRLNKKHSKQSKESERDKDRTNVELQDSMTQVTRLSSKLEVLVIFFRIEFIGSGVHIKHRFVIYGERAF
jgi:predicted RNase H-like nuclease (RuvC/YqgF family)